LIYQLRPGDVVYVDSIHFITRDGYEWLPIYAKWGQRLAREGYVTNFTRFHIEDNPLYNPPSEETRKIEDAVESSQTVAKWVLLVLSVLFAGWFLGMYFSEEGKQKVIGYSVNGMRKTFFFNPQPYLSIIFVTLMLIGAVAAAVCTMLILGGVVVGVLWIVKILCYVLVWVGIICCVLCGLALLSGDFTYIIGVIVGGLIWYFDDEIERFAEACANTGLTFFNEFNILGYTADLTVQYWRPVLIVTAIPLAIFLGLAVIWLFVAGVLILFEKIMTRRYSIKHPCPHCHQPSEPAIYLSKGDNGYEPLPNGIQLRPGMYGLFHITHPETEERMPTMLLNGRDSLARECANCGKRIQADEGTERHLAMVGAPQSGKSTLTYRMIAEIFNRAGRDKVEFTDEKNTIRDTGMIRKVNSIAALGRIEEGDLPAKTAVSERGSTQLVIRRPHAPVPYRLFINDVGGELFDPTSKSQSHNKTRFFRNVESIVFMVDPITTDFSDTDISDEFSEWLKKNATDNVRRLKIRDLQDTVDNQISDHGNSPKRIHLNIVLPKTDMGYLAEWANPNQPEMLRRFIEEEMGLGDLLHWAGKFADINFYALGAIARGDQANIAPILDRIISGQLGIRL
ncbi:MAG: hypothetical protein K2H15_09040, partial [Muribaculaceae bacterium]|nr:hypothetical protein [Muribaculaceae bacterium]